MLVDDSPDLWAYSIQMAVCLSSATTMHYLVVMAARAYLDWVHCMAAFFNPSRAHNVLVA